MMKKTFLFAVAILFVINFLIGCTELYEEEPKSKPKVEKIQTIKACCGEVGQLPDEPE